MSRAIVLGTRSGAHFDLGPPLAQAARMSLTKLAPLFAAAVLCAPSNASAQAEVVVPVIGAFLIVEGAVVIAGTVTGIGSTVHLTSDEPRLGWPIASMVTGGIGIAWGAMLTFVITRDGDDVDPGFWALALTPIAVGITTFSLGIAGLVRKKRAVDVELESEQWSLAPIILQGRDSQAPGLGAVVRF